MQGKPQWHRYDNIQMRFELCQNLAEIPLRWNIQTGAWLRHYVYERITPKGSKPTFWSMIVTQTVSGAWHGLYPGYLLFFGTSAFFLQAGKVIYRCG
jgi:lysophospholipid acyltransferase